MRPLLLLVLVLVAPNAAAWRTEPKETDVALSAGLEGPFRAIGRLRSVHGEVKMRGTGFFVGPCHVLTNAHALYSAKDPVTEKLRAEINSDLRAGKRSIALDFVRDASGRFDPAQAVRIEEVLWLDPREDSDVALSRTDRCLGVPEAAGHIKVLGRDAGPAFDKCLRERAPLVSAGYPADQPGDALQANSSDWYRPLTERSFEHRISNAGGSSGSPILCAFYSDAAGRQKPLDRAALGNTDERKRAYATVEYHLLGINKGDAAQTRLNYARLLNDSVINARIAYDLKVNAAALNPRIERARRP